MTDRRAAARAERWLQAVTRHSWGVLGTAMVVAALSVLAIVTRLGVDSDPLAMLDEDLPFRQTDAQLRAEFPALDDNLLIVIEAPTPEQAWLTARQVSAKLDGLPEVVESVSWPGGSDFFIDNGLLLQPLPRLEALTDRLADAQPLLGRLAGEVSAAGVLDLLALLVDQHDQLPDRFGLDDLLADVAFVLEESLAGEAAMLSWQARLAMDRSPGVAREVIIVNPALDHGRVLAAREVMRALRELRVELGLDRGPVRMKLTGSTPLRFEEMASVIDGAALTAGLALLVVTAVMWIGLRSPVLCLVALINLMLGLVITAGFAALAVGRVNLISVSFVVLYIGLGVNYAVHYLLRYRELLSGPEVGETDRLRAIHAAGRFLLRALVLSAATTALGFFAFVPTAFDGIAQLGLIAGVAMGVTLMLSYTVLPALLVVLRPQARPVARNAGDSGAWRDALLVHRGPTLAVGALLLIAALPLLPRVGFDSDPLKVRDPASESVTTIRELLRDGSAGYRNIQVLVPPAEEAAALAEDLAALPEVERAISLDSFVPNDQEDKLRLLDDLGWILGPDIVESDWALRSLSTERLTASAKSLRQRLDGLGAEAARRLQVALDRLADALASDAVSASLTASVNRALAGGMPASVGRLARGLRAERPITTDALPAWLEGQWVGRDGSRLVQVFPAGDVLEPGVQDAFTEAVVSVAGDRATGAPVIQQAAARAITDAFAQALLWAVLGITTVLMLTLRRLSHVAMVLAPLALGGVLTLAAMALLRLQFNFANVVALPLLLGVAVDNGIHLVERYRAGLLPNGNVLRTATARAIVVGALITAGGFGNLAFSPHAGTASLGLVLAIGLVLMVIATLVFLPALLGRGADGLSDKAIGPGRASHSDSLLE